MSNDLISPAEPTEGGATRRRLLTGMGAVAAGGGLLALASTPKAAAAVSDASYYSYGPSRFVDTRRQWPGRIHGGETQGPDIFDGSPNLTFAINLTVVNTRGSGYLAIFNGDGPRPTPYSTINWQ